MLPVPVGMVLLPCSHRWWHQTPQLATCYCQPSLTFTPARCFAACPAGSDEGLAVLQALESVRAAEEKAELLKDHGEFGVPGGLGQLAHLSCSNFLALQSRAWSCLDCFSKKHNPGTRPGAAWAACLLHLPTNALERVHSWTCLQVGQSFSELQLGSAACCMHAMHASNSRYLLPSSRMKMAPLLPLPLPQATSGSSATRCR